MFIFFQSRMTWNSILPNTIDLKFRMINAKAHTMVQKQRKGIVTPARMRISRYWSRSLRSFVLSSAWYTLMAPCFNLPAGPFPSAAKSSKITIIKSSETNKLQLEIEDGNYSTIDSEFNSPSFCCIISAAKHKLKLSQNINQKTLIENQHSKSKTHKVKARGKACEHGAGIYSSLRSSLPPKAASFHSASRPSPPQRI